MGDMKRITNEILMMSYEKYVRIIIGDMASLFCQIPSLRNRSEEKNATDVIIFF